MCCAEAMRKRKCGNFWPLALHWQYSRGTDVVLTTTARSTHKCIAIFICVVGRQPVLHLKHTRRQL